MLWVAVGRDVTSSSKPLTQEFNTALEALGATYDNEVCRCNRDLKGYPRIDAV